MFLLPILLPRLSEITFLKLSLLFTPRKTRHGEPAHDGSFSRIPHDQAANRSTRCRLDLGFGDPRESTKDRFVDGQVLSLPYALLNHPIRFWTPWSMKDKSRQPSHEDDVHDGERGRAWEGNTPLKVTALAFHQTLRRLFKLGWICP